jgi:hypothetical protein
VGGVNSFKKFKSLINVGLLISTKGNTGKSVGFFPA